MTPVSAPAVSLVRLRFAWLEVALRSNPAAAAPTIGLHRRQLFAELSLGHFPISRSRLDEVGANVSLRPTSGFAARRHAHSRLTIDTAGTATATKHAGVHLSEGVGSPVTQKPLSGEED